MRDGASGPPITVGLVQINNSFSGQNYLPYAVALLQGYVEAHAADPSRYRFLAPVYRRDGISRIVEALDGADVVGFSTYVWNERISLEIARRLKARKPDMLVVFGGPQVPDASEPFLRTHPFIDLAVHNEGEVTFADVLERLPDRDWSDVAGVSCLDDAGAFRRTPDRPRLPDLDAVPSPFLNGLFDRLIRDNPDERWIALWETNRGCPFRCTFCDWGSATAAKVTQFGMDRLRAEAEWFARNRIEYVFCCDANFGIKKRDVEIARLMAETRRRTGYPHALSVQNTKNATERAYLTQKILSDAGLNKGVALSMQSVDPATLADIRRENIALTTYLELQRRFTEDGVETYSDLILGLPGETWNSFADGVSRLIEQGQHNRIQFNNLSILPNAEMADAAYRERHGLRTVTSRIINIHGERAGLADDVDEVQELVVATRTMPEADWRRARAFSWMTALLHFDKLFQIPLMAAHVVSGAPWRLMIEAFLDADGARFPTVGAVRDLFRREAASIQSGGAEYVYSADWLGIHWPADEYAFIDLTATGRLDAFLREATTILREAVGADGDEAAHILRDAARLNRALVKQPFVSEDLTLTLDYDMPTFHRNARAGRHETPRRAPTRVEIDRTSERWDDFQAWCREVVWWGNKKGAYLYANRAHHREIAGHF